MFIIFSAFKYLNIINLLKVFIKHFSCEILRNDTKIFHVCFVVSTQISLLYKVINIIIVNSHFFRNKIYFTINVLISNTKEIDAK